MKRYKGIHRKQKIILGLSRSDEHNLRHLGTRIEDDVLAEILEGVTEHDTAAYADAFKLLIYRSMPHLRPYIEAVHFMDTSEDNWGNATALMLSELVFGYAVSEYIRFCESLIDHAIKYRNTGIWEAASVETPGGFLILPAFTHWQTATPTTYVKKVVTTVKQVAKLLMQLTDGNVFVPFTGKFGGITGNFDAHFGTYPDIDWFHEGRKFVEGLGLAFEPMANQCVPYTTEAQHFRTLRTINEQILKFAQDFRFYVSCPGQLFVKRLVTGQKGSSSNPGKTNLWQIEGAVRFLRKHNMLLEFLARELQDYPQEGDMGRSGLLRDVGNDFSNLFIGLSRITRELHACEPNARNIRAVFDKYPSVCMSTMQYVLKRARYKGDAYRAMQKLLFNPDGSYATRTEFVPRFETFLDDAGIKPEVRSSTPTWIPHSWYVRSMSMLRER